MDTNEFPQCGEEVAEETEKRTDCGSGISCEKQNEGGDWYEKMYGFYKKLPQILAIIIAVLFLIWSIIDIEVFSDNGFDYNYGGMYVQYEGSYGLMKLSSKVLVLFIWWAIGAVVALMSFFISSIVISPTVLRTDAVIALQMANKAESNKGELNETADKSVN